LSGFLPKYLIASPTNGTAPRADKPAIPVLIKPDL